MLCWSSRVWLGVSLTASLRVSKAIIKYERICAPCYPKDAALPTPVSLRKHISEVGVGVVFVYRFSLCPPDDPKLPNLLPQSPRVEMTGV